MATASPVRPPLRPASPNVGGCELADGSQGFLAAQVLSCLTKGRVPGQWGASPKAAARRPSPLACRPARRPDAAASPPGCCPTAGVSSGDMNEEMKTVVGGGRNRNNSMDLLLGGNRWIHALADPLTEQQGEQEKGEDDKEDRPPTAARTAQSYSASTRADTCAANISPPSH